MNSLSIGSTAILQNLRSELRFRRISAKQLADHLAVSEPTVWRWLRGDGLTLSKLDQICGLLGIDLRNLFDRETEERADAFTLAQERVLAKDRSLALVFFAILHGSQSVEIAETFRLPNVALQQHLERLSRLGLIHIGEKGRVRPLVKRSVAWRRGGPLAAAFDKTVKHLFFSEEFGSEEALYLSDAVFLTHSGREQVMALFQKLKDEIDLIVEQEQRGSVSRRELSGILMMIRALDVEELAKEWDAIH